MSTRSTLPAGLLIAPLLIVAAYFWPRHYKISVDPEDTPLRIFANGKRRGELTASAPSLEFWKLGFAELTAQAPTPCGWQDIGLTGTGEEKDRKLARDPYPDVKDGNQSWEGTQVWYDNRGGAVADISVGEFHAPIPADGWGTFRIWLSTCPGPFALKIDGNETSQAVADSSYFVDLGGERCYAWETVIYGEPGLSYQWTRRTLSGTRVYTVPWLTYFLVAPPDSINAVGLSREAVSFQQTECG